MNVTTHFTLEELTYSYQGARHGLDNTPGPTAMKNLLELCAHLESIRMRLGHPIHINSGYRSPAVNSAVGGSRTSAHMSGLAVDLTCDDFGSPLDVCRSIADSGIDFDQVIYEYGAWCHFGIVQQGLVGRRQTLTISATSNGYQPGLGEL